MTIKIIFRNRARGSTLDHGIKRVQDRIQKAVRSTSEEAARQILSEGRSDIAGAGKFGTRWTSGLHADVQYDPRRSTVQVYHTEPFFRVFEKGKVIHGKPLLWIPLSFATDAHGKKASEYGGLFRVNRKGAAPLLLSIATGEPKYFGKAKVRIPKKFHITEITKKVGGRLKQIYSTFWQRGK